MGGGSALDSGRWCSVKVGDMKKLQVFLHLHVLLIQALYLQVAGMPNDTRVLKFCVEGWLSAQEAPGIDTEDKTLLVKAHREEGRGARD